MEIRKRALNLLAKREHTKVELQRKLLAKGFVAEDIKSLLQELSKQKLQSDLRFVEEYVKIRSQRNFGPVRIAAELHERGVGQELSEKFLAKGGQTWFELAKLARRKKFGEKIPSNLSEKARQIRYLYYKGFTSDQIKAAISERSGL